MQQELTFSDTLHYFWHNILKSRSSKLNYDSVINRLDQLKTKVNMIGMEFPDIESFDFDTIKDEWIQLPRDVSSGVSTMGLHLEKDYRSILCHFQKNAHIKPHKHSKEYEVIKVLEGACFDMVTKQIFEQGDVFIIPKGQVHEIVTRGEECYMYILFSSSSEHLHLFHKELDQVKQGLKKEKPISNQE